MPRGRPKKQPIQAIEEKKISGEFSVSLQIGENTTQAKGGSVLDCLNELKFPPIKGWGLVVAKLGEKSADMKLHILRVRRLKANPVYRSLVAKYLTIGIT